MDARSAAGQKFAALADGKLDTGLSCCLQIILDGFKDLFDLLRDRDLITLRELQDRLVISDWDNARQDPRGHADRAQTIDIIKIRPVIKKELRDHKVPAKSEFVL